MSTSHFQFALEVAHSVGRVSGSAPVGAIYVGRPSLWGNPFRLSEFSRLESVTQFALSLDLLGPVELEALIEPLRQHRLLCHCSPRLCHAHVLASLAAASPGSGLRYRLCAIIDELVPVLNDVRSPGIAAGDSAVAS